MNTIVTTKFIENLLKNKDLHLLECEIEYKEDEDVYCSNSERNLCICNNNIDYIGIEKNIYFDEFDVTVYLTDNSFNSFTCDIKYIDLIKKMSILLYFYL